MGDGGMVVARGMTDGELINGDMRRVLALVLPVAERDTPRPVHSYDVLVVLSYLNHDSGAVPLGWMRANQVL